MAPLHSVNNAASGTHRTPPETVREAQASPDVNSLASCGCLTGPSASVAAVYDTCSPTLRALRASVSRLTCSTTSDLHAHKVRRRTSCAGSETVPQGPCPRPQLQPQPRLLRGLILLAMLATLMLSGEPVQGLQQLEGHEAQTQTQTQTQVGSQRRLAGAAADPTGTVWSTVGEVAAGAQLIRNKLVSYLAGWVVCGYQQIASLLAIKKVLPTCW
jgi:hypothetical protein